MTTLALAARNYLAQQPSVTSLLGGDVQWQTWIFVDAPERPVENSGTCLIVISQNGSWAPANDYNTARFPRLIVDIWGDPTRNPDKSMRQRDAKIKIDTVYKAVDKFLHLVDASGPDGSGIIWGTPAQISAKTGVRIDGSKRQGEPDYSPTFDNKGGFMGRINYNISI